MKMSDSHLVEHEVSSETLLKGNFLHVKRDTVCLPDGAFATREYVVHPGAVMIVPLLLDSDGNFRLVLERQFRYPVNRVMIEFPAGKLDPGEMSQSCAERELREETGFVAEEWARVGVLHPVISYSTEFIDVWFAKSLTSGTRKLDQGEFLDIFTASTTEFFDWCISGLITDAKTLSVALWLQSFLSSKLALIWRPSLISTHSLQDEGDF